jgi:hypothetical protein
MTYRKLQMKNGKFSARHRGLIVTYAKICKESVLASRRDAAATEVVHAPSTSSPLLKQKRLLAMEGFDESASFPASPFLTEHSHQMPSLV